MTRHLEITGARRRRDHSVRIVDEPLAIKPASPPRGSPGVIRRYFFQRFTLTFGFVSPFTRIAFQVAALILFMSLCRWLFKMKAFA